MYDVFDLVLLLSITHLIYTIFVGMYTGNKVPEIDRPFPESAQLNERCICVIMRANLNVDDFLYDTCVGPCLWLFVRL